MEAVKKNIYNPQSSMIGAKSISLGHSPVLENDLGNALLNPASLSQIDVLPLSTTMYRLYGEFNYFVLSVGGPKFFTFRSDKDEDKRRFGFSASYAHVKLDNIPNTVSYNELPYQVGTFSSGFRVGHVAGATQFYDVALFNRVSIGMAIKFVDQFVGSSHATGFGFDSGVIGELELDYKFFDSLLLGAAVHNLFSTPMKFDTTGNESVLPLQFYFGSRLNLFEDRLSLFSSLNDFGLTFGTEVMLEEGFYTRASSNFKSLQLGIGIELDQIPTGIDKYSLRGRADFTYSQSAFPMNSNPTYIISISSLGRSIPKQPQILKPAGKIVRIPNRHILLSGVGPKNSTIRIYNNDEIHQSTLTNKMGRWKVKRLPLNEGENKLYVQSYDIKKEFSVKSNDVMVVSDTSSPEIRVDVFPNNDKLDVYIYTNELLSKAIAVLQGKKIDFKQDDSYVVPVRDASMIEDGPKVQEREMYRYKGTMPIPNSLKMGVSSPKEFMSMDVVAEDETGNKLEIADIIFFGMLSFPLDKHVHYSESLRSIGVSSELLNMVYINKNGVVLDSENRFSFPVDLNPGKNLLEVVFEAKNNSVLRFYNKVLRLVSYDDMDSKVKGRREIEFLSTLGILTGDDDGSFYPKRNVTRQYITKLMVLALEEPITEVTYNLFDDVPQDHPFASYIQTGLNTGFIFAFPDGTFKPGQEMTLAEVVDLLSSAGIIDYIEVEEGDQLVTRAQLAEFLAYTPKLEKKIEKLINWDIGYDVPKE
ncbi:S-layer homology domain-containing protein [bacterium]|nr:S-layer homology domain-containing protein [bacterium]